MRPQSTVQALQKPDLRSDLFYCLLLLPPTELDQVIPDLKPPQNPAVIGQIVNDPFKFLKANQRLPSPPGIAVRILQLVESEDSSLEDISNVISSDPVLTGKILKYVHSPLVGLGSQGTTIREAVAQIGMRGAQMLALSFSLISAEKKNSCPSFDLDRFWSESVARAVAARRLTKHLSQGDPEDAFITALLCRLGQLVYATGLAQKYEPVLSVKQHGDLPLEERERNAFGIDHIKLSVLLLQDWQLPETVWKTVEAFAHAEFTSSPTRCLAVADAIGAMLARSDQQDATAFARVLELGERHLDLEAQESEDLLKQIGTDWTDYGRILSVETGKTPDLESIRQEAEELLETLRVATQIEVSNLRSENEQLNQIAQRDRLTSLYNRGAFDDALATAMQKAQNSTEPLTLFMIDIDHFKKVNDAHGHPTGDGVLQHAARLITTSVRREGTAFRYGGEEFAVLASNCTIDQARKLAESIRQTIERSPFRDGDNVINLTVSIGIATAEWPEKTRDTSTLVSCADRRLYEAKSSGRNAWRAESNEAMSARTKPSRGMLSRLGRIFAAE